MKKQVEQTNSTLASEDSISDDDIFHILQNERRRYVLQYLQEQAGECTLRDLARQIAAWENETSPQQVSSDERQRVYIALYQAHLPKLDDFGVIDYNQARGIIKQTDLADMINQYRLLHCNSKNDNTTDNIGDDKNQYSYFPVTGYIEFGIIIFLVSVLGFVIGRWTSARTKAD